MSPYIYRGNKPDLEPRPEPPKPGVPEGPVSKCGTTAGYKRHRRRGEPACPDCLTANTEYTRNRRAQHGKPPALRLVGTYNPEHCGTTAGYARHRRANTTPCNECRAAWAEYARNRKAAA